VAGLTQGCLYYFRRLLCHSEATVRCAIPKTQLAVPLSSPSSLCHSQAPARCATLKPQLAVPLSSHSSLCHSQATARCATRVTARCVTVKTQFTVPLPSHSSLCHCQNAVCCATRKPQFAVPLPSHSSLCHSQAMVRCVTLKTQLAVPLSNHLCHSQATHKPTTLYCPHSQLPQASTTSNRYFTLDTHLAPQQNVRQPTTCTHDVLFHEAQDCNDPNDYTHSLPNYFKTASPVTASGALLCQHH